MDVRRTYQSEVQAEIERSQGAVRATIASGLNPVKGAIIFYAVALVIALVVGFTMDPTFGIGIVVFLGIVAIPLTHAITHMQADTDGIVRIELGERVLVREKDFTLLKQDRRQIPQQASLVLDRYRIHSRRGSGSDRETRITHYVRLYVMPVRVQSGVSAAAFVTEQGIALPAGPMKHRPQLPDQAIPLAEDRYESSIEWLAHFISDELDVPVVDAR